MLTDGRAAQVRAMLHENQVFSNLFAQLQTYIRTHYLQAAVTAVNEPRGIVTGAAHWVKPQTSSVAFAARYTEERKTLFLAQNRVQNV